MEENNNINVNEEKPYLIVETIAIKKVSDYSSLNFSDCMELDIYTFAVLLRDAFVYNLKQSQEGRDYLEECYLFKQTKPDRKKLRERFGGDNE